MPRKPFSEKALAERTGDVKQITPKIDELLELLVAGRPLAEAAEAVGYQRRHALRALSSPFVLKEFNKRIEEVRTGERARNILAAARVRDVVFTREAFTAAEGKAALEAGKWLHGEVDEAAGKPAGARIPGYVIVLPVAQLPAQQQASAAKPLIEHEPLTERSR